MKLSDFAAPIVGLWAEALVDAMVLASHPEREGARSGSIEGDHRRARSSLRTAAAVSNRSSGALSPRAVCSSSAAGRGATAELSLRRGTERVIPARERLAGAFTRLTAASDPAELAR